MMNRVVGKEGHCIIKKRRILYLFTSTKYGGAKKHFLSFMQYANTDLVDITVISSKNNFPAEIQRRLNGFRFSEYNFGKLDNFLKWIKFFRENKPDKVVFAETWFTDFTWRAVFAGWLLTRGDVYMMEYTEMFGLGKSGKGVLEKFSLRKNNLRIRALLSKCVLANSNSMKRKMVEDYNYPEGKIKVAYPPIDTDRFSPMKGLNFEIRDRHGILCGDLVCIVVSRLEKVKAVDKVIEAFNILLRGANRKDMWLWILGEGALRDELIKLAEGSYFADRVIFFGYQENVEKYMQESDIFILASETEAFGMTLVEAMATGLICIATPTGGAKEVMWEKGYIIEQSAESLASALFEVIKMDKGERDKMKKEARRYVLEKFDRVREVKKHLDALGIPSIL